MRREEAPPPRPERFSQRVEIGRGGYGTVERAFDRRLGTEVAIKTLVGGDRLDVVRFKREFRAVSELLHPNLVRMYELFADGDRWYFTMELVDGVRFDRYLGAGDGRPPALDRARLAAAMVQLTHALTTLHALGMVHRDIKPANVLVTREGRVVVLDYGLIQAAHAPFDRGEILGTAAYVSPGQLRGAPPTPASDWFSVGVMLYELLTGVAPFGADPMEIMTRTQRDAELAPLHAAGVDADLIALCQGLLARDPAQRSGASQILMTLGGAGAATGLIAAAAPRFVGRAELLDELAAARALVQPDQATVLLLTGPSGIGKSSLAHAYVDRLDPATHLVLRGRCFEREVVPYQALDDLIESLTTALLDAPHGVGSLPEDVALVARLFAGAARVPEIADRVAVVPSDPAELRRRALRAVAELIWRVADRRTVVIVIDDLQWSDQDGASALLEVVRQLASASVLLIATCRSAPEVRQRAALLDGTASAAWAGLAVTVRELEVPPLAPDEVAALAAAIQPSIPAAAVADIARTAGGNPAFILELARVQAADARGGAPITLARLLHDRIAALPSAARDLLATCAVAPRPVPIDGAIEASRCADPIAVLSSMRIERLIRVTSHRDALWIEPYHDRIRVAVLATLADGERRRLATALARTLERRAGATAAELAELWRSAGDDTRAQTLARAAAAEAERGFAFHHAAAMYRLALATTELPDDERRALTRHLADCLTSGGRLDEAIEVVTAAVTTAAGLELRELRRIEVENRLRRSDHVVGLARLRELLRELGIRLPPPRGMMAAIAIATVRARLRGLRFARRAPEEVAAADLQRVDILMALTMALTYINAPIGTLIQHHHLRHALAAREPVRVARALCVELPRLAMRVPIGHRRLVALADRLRTMNRELADPELSALVEWSHGFAAHLQGRWRESALHFTRAEALGRAHLRSRWLVTGAQVLRLAASWYLGTTDEIVRNLPTYLAEAVEMGDAHAAGILRMTRTNVYWLLVDQPDVAEREARQAAPPPRAGGEFQQHDYLLLQALLHVDLYRGDGAAAMARMAAAWPRFTRSILRRSRQLRIEMAWLRGRAALAARDTTGNAAAIAVATRCAAALSREQLPWAHAAAAAVRAGIARARGADVATLRTALDAAADAAFAVDMKLLGWAAQWQLAAWCDGAPGARLGDQRLVAPAKIVRTWLPG